MGKLYKEIIQRNHTGSYHQGIIEEKHIRQLYMEILQKYHIMEKSYKKNMYKRIIEKKGTVIIQGADTGIVCTVE